MRVKQRYLAKDKHGQLVFLADSAFSLQMTQQKYPSITFHFVSNSNKKKPLKFSKAFFIYACPAGPKLRGIDGCS